MGGLVLVQFAQGQTVDEIISKYADVRGGLHKLLGINSIVMEGVQDVMGNEVKMRITKVQGKLSRNDFETIAGSGFTLLTDKAGWNFFAFRSAAPEKLTDKEVAAEQTEMDIAGPLINYHTKGHKAELLGKEEIEGVNTYKIKLTTAKGKEIVYWIDAQTHLLLQTLQKKEGVSSAALEPITMYSNYKEVDGVLFAHTAITKVAGSSNTNTITFSKIELNVPVEDKLYKPE